MFCRTDRRANVAGPHCARCGRGIIRPNGTGERIAWCYVCGIDTGTLPEIEIPLYWSRGPDASLSEEVKEWRGQ
jgi:hypothetical protein